MKIACTISEKNVLPHLDIEHDIKEKKNGLFTFNLRINRGFIEDYAYYETITAKDYDGSVYIIGRESGATYDPGTGSTENAVRPGNR